MALRENEDLINDPLKLKDGFTKSVITNLHVRLGI